MATEFEVHTAFGRFIQLWTDLRLTNKTTSLSLAMRDEGAYPDLLVTSCHVMSGRSSAADRELEWCEVP